MVSIDGENTSDKIQHPFLIKKNFPGNRKGEELPKHEKEQLQKCLKLLTGERLDAFALRLEESQ